MNNGFSLIFKKYVVAAIITVVGLALLIYGLNPANQQETLFKIAAANILIGGILAILLSSGLVKKNIIVGVALLCLGITAYLTYQTVSAINTQIAHNELRDKSELFVQQSLIEIRDIQRSFKNVNNRYAASWDELKNFYENDSVPEAISVGSVPSSRPNSVEMKLLYGGNKAADNNMTEWEATRLARMDYPTKRQELVGFRRDTVKKPFKAMFNGNKMLKKNRELYGMTAFNIDSLEYVPLSIEQDKWELFTNDSTFLNGDTIPSSVIQVKGLEPVAKNLNGKKSFVGFGDLKKASEKGTWE